MHSGFSVISGARAQSPAPALRGNISSPDPPQFEGLPAMMDTEARNLGIPLGCECNARDQVNDSHRSAPKFHAVWFWQWVKFQNEL